MFHAYCCDALENNTLEHLHRH